VQVCKELREIGQFQHLKMHVVYGGASINIQLDDLAKGVDILIATPGRLLDLSQRGALRIHEFDICILDEADQMLDMGFIDDMSTILNQLPKQRMMLLISATVDESILSIARTYITHSKTIEIGEIEKAATISEEHIEATDLEKFPRLLDVLRTHKDMKILIFRETKLASSRLQEKLWDRGFKAGVLQGDMTQAKRNKVLHDFKEGHLNILVATNVAGRGLHIENLGLVVNYDRAKSEEMHLHRIGRTGRMGQEGKAINFVKRKESLKERMGEEHPDFAWMRQGGTDSYRSDERPPRREHRRDERPRSGYRSHSQGENPYKGEHPERGERRSSHGGGHAGSHGGSHSRPQGEHRRPHRRPSHPQ
jgi:superfamily II DNA/RNA helicase